MTVSADLLIGNFALLLYFSESKKRRQNSAKLFVFQSMLLVMPVFYWLIQKYFENYDNNSQDRTRW